jgi:hypothetical protein
VAVDPEKVAEQPAPEPDSNEEGAAEVTESPTEPKDEGQPETQTEPGYITELREKLERAERAANEAREYARRAQGTSEKSRRDLEKDVARLTSKLNQALTANMSDEEKRAFERDQRLERLEEEKLAPQQNGDDPALREWQSFAARALEKVGIKHDDPRLVAAFQKHNENSSNPSDWPVALAAAIAEIGKTETERVRTDAQKAADAERVKARNESRKAEGKIDRSSPSGQARVRVDDMTNEEFDKHWEQQKAAAARRA